MKKIVVSVALALTLAGCGPNTPTSAKSLVPSSSSGEFTMTMSFDPAPPKQGDETISISVTDGAGRAVTGAVVKATTKMPAMSMSGPSPTFQDNGDGTYSALINMNYQTKWVIDAKVTADERSGTAEFEQVVK